MIHNLHYTTALNNIAIEKESTGTDSSGGIMQWDSYLLGLSRLLSIDDWYMEACEEKIMKITTMANFHCLSMLNQVFQSEYYKYWD